MWRAGTREISTYVSIRHKGISMCEALIDPYLELIHGSSCHRHTDNTGEYSLKLCKLSIGVEARKVELLNNFCRVI